MRKTTNIGALVRFAIVGGSFSLGYAIVVAALISFAAAPPLITSIIIYLICIPLAFFAQKKFAFRVGQTGRLAMFIYGATQLVSLALVSLITSRFVTMVFILDIGLFLIVAGSAAVASYLICRFLIFRPSAGSDAQ